jgi:hypothetical protein
MHAVYFNRDRGRLGGPYPALGSAGKMDGAAIAETEIKSLAIPREMISISHNKFIVHHYVAVS